MKVILDCNILVSAGLKSRVCNAVLRYALRETQVVFSIAILSEYQEVLTRKKFAAQQENMQKILLAMYAGGALIANVPESNALSPDPKDQPYIDLALAAQADYLITGNMQDFPDSPYGVTHAIKPASFLDLLKIVF
jgi:putative PIN family toxin of toxin-antitoxin system